MSAMLLLATVLAYWQFYPAEGGLGHSAGMGLCYGYSESNCGDIPVGERLWGYFPMASHAVLTPGQHS